MAVMHGSLIQQQHTTRVFSRNRVNSKKFEIDVVCRKLRITR